MKSLYLRIYGTVVAVLLLFAAASSWVFQRHLEQDRQRAEIVFSERISAWAELLEHALPPADATSEAQAAAVREWSTRLRIPLALDDADGRRVADSDLYQRRVAEGQVRVQPVRLADGRTLWLMRPGLRPNAGGPWLSGAGPQPPPGGRVPAALDGPPGGAGPDGPPPHFHGFGRGADEPGGFLPFLPLAWVQGVGLVVVLAVLFLAVALGAYPVVRRLTRRLEALQRGVEQFGAGELSHRIVVGGHDEVAAVATSFNVAADQIEGLVRSHKSLLANASHELRSPLARLKMAVSMLDGASDTQRERLGREINTNVAELDALVEEVLLASRLDATPSADALKPIELLSLAAEEGAPFDAQVGGESLTVRGDERLLRRALRNLLENARRYGGGQIDLTVTRSADRARVAVEDRGPGVPEAMRERIFEAFFRLPGHAEMAGGVGLGLSLVKQIAERHGGQAQCLPRAGGGSCFVLLLPLARN